MVVILALACVLMFAAHAQSGRAPHSYLIKRLAPQSGMSGEPHLEL
jgi:hypothetical protein